MKQSTQVDKFQDGEERRMGRTKKAQSSLTLTGGEQQFSTHPPHRNFLSVS